MRDTYNKPHPLEYGTEEWYTLQEDEEASVRRDDGYAPKPQYHRVYDWAWREEQARRAAMSPADRVAEDVAKAREAAAEQRKFEAGHRLRMNHLRTFHTFSGGHWSTDCLMFGRLCWSFWSSPEVFRRDWPEYRKRFKPAPAGLEAR